MNAKQRTTLSADEIALREELTKRYPILKFFSFAHLPAGPMRETSARHADLAFGMATELKGGAEVSAGLRKLLEAKDCFVRAALPA